MIVPPIALSVRQPWAWAIICAGKDIENRTPHAVSKGRMRPGTIAIHASKGMTRSEYEMARDYMLARSVECPRPDELVRGGIIGWVTVTDIVKESFSTWFQGSRGLVLKDPVRCPDRPIAAKGELGYFQWAEAGELEQSKPWMRSWPHDWRPHRKDGTGHDDSGRQERLL